MKTSTLDAELRARVPKPLKKRIAAIARQRSKNSGNMLTASDIAREALHQFVTADAKQKAA